ncbi:MAG: 4-hydroxybenzoate solanesyltransferase [Pseudanabaenaceae cyanobacterium]
MQPWIDIVRLLRWDKPTGRVFLVFTAQWGVVVGGRGPAPGAPPDVCGVVVLGSLAASAAGCVINDLWDRDLDRQVARTRTRPLAARSLSVAVGLVVLAIAGGCALLAAAYLQPLSLGLCMAAIPVIVVYPACKRFFPVPQLVLSIAWSFAVLVPWSALTQRLDRPAWELAAAVLVWTLGFDTIYALNDREDDLRVGIRSSAIFFGDRTPLVIGLCFALAAGLLGIVGRELGLTWPYWGAWAIAVGLWGHQYQQLQGEGPIPAGRLFQENAIAGGILLGGAVGESLWRAIFLS